MRCAASSRSGASPRGVAIALLLIACAAGRVQAQDAAAASPDPLQPPADMAAAPAADALTAIPQPANDTAAADTPAATQPINDTAVADAAPPATEASPPPVEAIPAITPAPDEASATTAPPPASDDSLAATNPAADAKRLPWDPLPPASSSPSSQARIKAAVNLCKGLTVGLLPTSADVNNGSSTFLKCSLGGTLDSKGAEQWFDFTVGPTGGGDFDVRLLMVAAGGHMVM